MIGVLGSLVGNRLALLLGVFSAPLTVKDSLDAVAEDLWRMRTPYLLPMVREVGSDEVHKELEYRRLLGASLPAGVAEPLRSAIGNRVPALSEVVLQDLADRCFLLADSDAGSDQEFAALRMVFEVCRGSSEEAAQAARREAMERLAEDQSEDSLRLQELVITFLVRETDLADVHSRELLATLAAWSERESIHAVCEYYSAIFPELRRAHRRQRTAEELDALQSALQRFAHTHGAERHVSGWTFHQVALRDQVDLQRLRAGAVVEGSFLPAPETLQGAREYIRHQVHVGSAPSVAVAVVHGGKLVWAEGFGFADLERNRPATSDSVYILASISKPITATGVMMLADQGRLDLDAPANAYLPGSKVRAYRGSAEDITLRRLASHMAGFPTHWNFYYEGVELPSRDESIRRYGFADRVPGSAYNYSNFGYGVLDYIVGLVARKPWGTFMEKELYDPLGMHRTSHHVRPGLEDHAARHYRHERNGGFARVFPYGFDHDGASAIWTSATDLARFALFHLRAGELDGVRLLSKTAAQAMQVESTQGQGSYGLGWALGNESGCRRVSHSGGMPGVSTHLNLYPNQQSAVVVLTNSNNDLAFRVARVLAAAVLEGATEEQLAEEVQQAPSDPPQELPRWIGNWRGNLDHFSGKIPAELRVSAGSRATFLLGTDRAEVAELTLRGNELHGRASGLPIETQPGFDGEPALHLVLRYEGDTLSGVVAASASAYFRLPHWIELRRQ
jgi:CubicO group peptidase (beta-lactamase class C family)